MTTLQILQDKMKRQPALYRNELHEHFGILKEKLAAFKESPGKRDE